MQPDQRDLELWSGTWRSQIEAALADALPRLSDRSVPLLDAAGFGLLGPAKRLRALLVIATVEDAGRDPARALGPACAIEMIHAASLILDDMPCMDNARLRRDRLATHCAYGESTAILAAVGLIARSFERLASDPDLAARARASNVEQLAEAIGFLGLSGGQYLDLNAQPGVGDFDQIADLYRRKTGALFGLALSFGATIADLTPDRGKRLALAGTTIGLAFQIYDDLIDAYATTTEAGKDVGMDAGKATAIKLLGPDGAARHARELIGSAIELIAGAIGRGRATDLVMAVANSTVGRIGKVPAASSGSRAVLGDLNG